MRANEKDINIFFKWANDYKVRKSAFKRNKISWSTHKKWYQKKIGETKPWIIASFHPAFLMRQPEQKKKAWVDLKMIRDKIGK